MWYPVFVPYVTEAPLNIYDSRSARAALCPMIPFDQRVYLAVNETVGFRYDPTYAEDGRKYLLKRSLFDLFRHNHSLEITDPKLLGWYLSLPVEDRTIIQQEGGLVRFIQTHPALELITKCVYLKKQFRADCSPQSKNMSSNHQSKHPTLHSVSHCHSCGSSFHFGSKKCQHCGIHVVISEQDVFISENEKELEMLPSNVREELNDITDENDISSPGEAMYSTQAQSLSQLWKEVEQREDTKHYTDLTAQASFSLDIELDMQSRAQRVNHSQHDQHQLYKESEDVENDCDMNREVLPEYYSLNHTEWSDDSHHTEAGFNDSIMATRDSTELPDEPSETNIASIEDSSDCFISFRNSFELANDSVHHLEDLQNKEHASCEQQTYVKSTSSVQLLATPCPSFCVNQAVDASGDFRACFTSTRATEVCQILQTKACRSVATDTDSLPVSNKKNTHTMQMSTSDKSTVTEVDMADLDILTEEFMKLKDMEKELKKLKDRKSRPIPGGDHSENAGGCDCAQRVKRAELRLLSLQYIMCQQHCWRRYFTSPLGESAHQGTEGLPNIITDTLNELEKDYQKMMRRILEGTPLDELKPLSVDSQKIMTTGTYYSPASVLKAHLGSFDCLGSTIANCHGVDEKAKEMTVPLCQNTEVIQDEPKNDSSNRGKQPGTSSDIKDLNGSEAWFDAEEDLQDGNVEKQNDRREGLNNKRTDGNKSNQSSLLCVTCLPDNVTEQEMLMWFEKYNATGVCISTFSNNLRAAVVYLKNPSDAQAAVKDLNGCTFHGHTVYVQQLSGSTSTHPNQSHQPPNATETNKAEMDGLKTKAASARVSYSPSARGPRCSVDRLTKVCDSPTASGTCVPQRYAGTGSFNTIMTRLSEQHPDIDRQRIIDAVLKLRVMNQGILRGFTLSTIVDMTSKLLTEDFSSKSV